jgi:hypothetical protein
MGVTAFQKARETQIANIEKKSGKSLAHLKAAIRAQRGLKHGEMRSMLMERYSIGHGDANLLIHHALRSDGESRARELKQEMASILGDIYAGKKAQLRPIHDRVMEIVDGFGDFEIAPKKGYVSLRRTKQFAMLGPKTNERIELGLNYRGSVLQGGPVVAAKPGGMCQFVVSLTSPDQVNRSVTDALRLAFDAAG